MMTYEEMGQLTESIRALLKQMEINDCTPSLSQAVRFKKALQEGRLTVRMIAEIMAQEKANQKEMFRLPAERIRRFSQTTSPKETEAFVLKACEFYRKHLNRQRAQER